MGSLLSGVGMKFFELVLPTLATALAGLGVAFLTKKLQSVGITVEQQQQQQLKDLAAHTIVAIEEQAHRDKAAGKDTLTGAQKDATAVAIVQSKLPQADPADVRLAIDAALPATRALKSVLVPSTPATFGR